jgi:hypothetical protein
MGIGYPEDCGLGLTSVPTTVFVGKLLPALSEFTAYSDGSSRNRGIVVSKKEPFAVVADLRLTPRRDIYSFYEPTDRYIELVVRVDVPVAPVAGVAMISSAKGTKEYDLVISSDSAETIRSIYFDLVGAGMEPLLNAELSEFSYNPEQFALIPGFLERVGAVFVDDPSIFSGEGMPSNAVAILDPSTGTLCGYYEKPNEMLGAAVPGTTRLVTANPKWIKAIF